MKRLIYSILFIVILLFAFDRIGGAVMWWVNQHSNDVSAPKIRYLVNTCDQELITMGTSRSNLHYVPSIICDTIVISVYNGGIDGSDNIYAHYIMLNHILSHHIPRIICLEVMWSDFLYQEKGSFNTLSFFAPYIGLNARADSVFREAGTYWRYKISHLYRYNAKAVSNTAGLLVNRQSGGDNGYIPLPPPPHFPDTLKNSDFVFSCDSNKVKYIRKFISLCREHNILLVFTVSPVYLIASPNEYGVLKQIADENGIPFFDYHSAGLFFDHPEYFKDNVHLWDKGARLFTSVFAHDLKMYLDSVGFFEKEQVK